jgi:hypothetical protein
MILKSSEDNWISKECISIKKLISLCVFGLAFGRAKSNSRGVELILDWF